MTTDGEDLEHIIESEEITIDEDSFRVCYNKNDEIKIQYYNNIKLDELYQFTIKKNIFLSIFGIYDTCHIYNNIRALIKNKNYSLKKENCFKINMIFNKKEFSFEFNKIVDNYLFSKIFKKKLDNKDKEISNIKQEMSREKNNLQNKIIEKENIINDLKKEIENLKKENENLKRKSENIIYNNKINNSSKVINNNYKIVQISIDNQIANNSNISEFNTKYNTIINNKEKEIKLSFIQDGNELLENLSQIKFDNLEKLYLYTNKINDISPIKEMNFTSLMALDLTNNSIENIYPLEKKDLRHLEILNLGKNKISDIEPLKNLNCMNLKILHLENNKIEDITPLSFQNFISLEELYLNNNRIKDISSFEKASFKDNLTLLFLYYNKINDINVLVNFKKLKKLYIYKNNLNKNNQNIIKEINELKEFIKETSF